ncbi:hypothetical protein OAV52_00790 [Planktomarina temperata]|nr:hypothetical protein [Planktomarina temperata]
MRILIIIVMFFVPSALLAKDYVCAFQEGLETNVSPYRYKSKSVVRQEPVEVSDIEDKNVSALKLPEYFSMNDKFLETRARQLLSDEFIIEATYSEDRIIVSMVSLDLQLDDVRHSIFSFSENTGHLVVHETDTGLVPGNNSSQSSSIRSNVYLYRCLEDI